MFEFERAVSYESLFKAFEKIKGNNIKNCGFDNINTDYYSANLYDNLQLLHYSLVSDQYIPYKEKMFVSKKGRKIYISCLEDKIVQTSVAQVISEMLILNSAVHSFIKRRSIFTAHSKLKEYMLHGIDAFYKIDIRKFYESISREMLLKKLKELTGDIKFLALVKCILLSHSNGISTGSCLSPVLSNLYMKDFDDCMTDKHKIYLRYVDDMLISSGNTKQLPEVINDVKDELCKINLSINQEKSQIVTAEEGFKYLGFDIKEYRKMDELLEKGDLQEAEKLIEHDNDNLKNEKEIKASANTAVSNETDNYTSVNSDDNEAEYTVPVHIFAVEKKCHIIRYLINKAKTEKFLSYPEKRVLLCIYNCLGNEGTRYLHKILSNCIDYNYNITQGYINRCGIKLPIGCKKVCDAFEGVCDKSHCSKCNFKNEKIYPTPLIHALRQKSDCFKMPDKAENIGHFKKLPIKSDINNTLSRVIELNKKSHELNLQKDICKTHLEDLFAKNEYTQIDTPYGLLIKNEEGVFIKIG